jgi:hypothetical protein
LVSRNTELKVPKRPPHQSVLIPCTVIDLCVVHEEVEKGNLLAGALVVIYVFDYQ